MQASALADRHLRTALCTAPVQGCRAESSWGEGGGAAQAGPEQPHWVSERVTWQEKGAAHRAVGRM